MNRKLLIAFLLLSLPMGIAAQTDTDEQLAAQYFKNGELQALGF